MNPAITERRPRKRFGRPLLVGGTLLAFVVGAAFVWSIVAQERRTAAMRAKGYPTTLMELNAWYASPPVGENAADYYLEAGRQIEASDFPELDQIAVLGSSSESAKLGIFGEEVSPEEMRRTSAFLLYHEEAYELMAQATQFEGSRYPVDYTNAPAVTFDHLSAVRNVWRAQLLKFYFHSESGQAPKAVAAFEHVVHVVNSLDGEPSSLAALTRIPLVHGASRAAEYLLNTVSLGQDELEILDRALLSLMDNNHVLRVAVGDRCYDLGLLNNATGVPGALASIAESGHLKAYDDFIELAEKPPHEIVRELKIIRSAPQSRAELHDFAWLDQWTNVLPMRNEGLLAKVALYYLDEDARVAAARAAVIIERARADGRPAPDELDDLAVEHRKVWPLDPFTNEPIRYRRLTSGYVTYSVGQDLQDNGGLDESAEWDAHHERSNPDVAFRILR